jgi:hypothetical protein
MTTIGFGDYAIENPTARGFLVVYAHVGIFITGIMGSFVAEAIVKRFTCESLIHYATKTKSTKP